MKFDEFLTEFLLKTLLNDKNNNLSNLITILLSSNQSYFKFNKNHLLMTFYRKNVDLFLLKQLKTLKMV